MRIRAIDSTGDWTYGAGPNNYLTATSAVAQLIGTRLMMFLGDCFFATDQGLDWWTFLGGSKNQVALQLALGATILNTQSQGSSVVTGINTVNVNLDTKARAFSISYSVNTIFGAVSDVVNLNLGVGPLAPPVASLLPQFNQTLLNNASATAITNAVFNSSVWWEIDLVYFIERRTSTETYTQRGVLICKYDISSATWSIDNVVFSGSSGPATGVTFTINSSTGQVSYASDNMTGSSYVGNLIIGSGATFPAGV